MSVRAVLCSAAAAQPGTAVRCLPVSDVSCTDLTWMHGVALGSPVYWGTMSGEMKLFLDRVQQRCFDWPVTALRWRAGAAFATGAHEASGKVQTIQALHSFYLSVQMVPVGNEPSSACLLGACATNHNESTPVPSFTAAEEADARSLAVRLVALSRSLRGLMEDHAAPLRSPTPPPPPPPPPPSPPSTRVVVESLGGRRREQGNEGGGGGGGEGGADAPRVDFEFQVLGINTTRQSNGTAANKTLDVYVRWRYRPGKWCPFLPGDNTCVQYQLQMHDLVLNTALRPTPELPRDAEWELVNLALCQGLWANWSARLSAVSTAVHVNGDGRDVAQRGYAPYEPGAHGTVCTIGDEGLAPIELPNRLPNYGAL